MLDHSVEAEQSILGQILSYPELLEDAISIVSLDDFYVSAHKEIFKAMISATQQGIGIDAITLKSNLPAYISKEMIDDLYNKSSTNMFLDHLNVVHNYGFRRLLKRSCNEIVNSLSDEDNVPIDELVGLVNKKMNESLDHAVGSQAQASSYKDMMRDYLVSLSERAESEDIVMGVTTGITEFDNLTYGFQPGDMIVLAARPSMGKTALALNIAENECLKGGRVMIFSMEMPSVQLLNRSIASIGRINQNSLKTGRLSHLEQGHLSRAVETLNNMDIIIDDQGGLTMAQVRSRAIKEHRKKPLTFLLIDYLQLMSGPPSKNKGDNRTQEVTDISKGIKQLAKELGIPIVALSQLNRSLEQRQDKRPINSDLRESGSIEQDADIIMFIYRDEVYNPDTTEKGIAEIIIGKQRNGPLGTVRTRFVGHYSRFENLPKVESIEEGSLANSPLSSENNMTGNML